MLAASTFINTTTTAITDTNITSTVSNIIINNTNNAIKYHKGKNETWNELHRRIRANRGDNSSITNTTTNQPSSGIWNGHSGKRKGTQFKRKLHGKIIKNQEAFYSYKMDK